MDIRPIEASDLPALQAFSDRFNRPGSSTFRPDFLAWQYGAAARAAGLDHAGDGAGISAAFDSAGQVLGYCSGHHMRSWWQGCEVPGLWLHEWFVDPNASGIGFRLFDEIAKGAELVGVAGGSIDTMNVFLRLAPAFSWFELTRLAAVLDTAQCFRLLPPGTPARSMSILKAIKPRLTEDPSVELTDLAVFGDETDRLWAQAATQCLIAADRSARSLNWRYGAHPIFRYDRVLARSDAGEAVLVWRMETVQGIAEPITVARLCDAIGAPAALTRAMPAVLRRMAAEGVALCDFFGSHARTLNALTAGGMSPVVATAYLDLPRLFAPLHYDPRRTINMSCFLRSASPEAMRRPHDFMFTKGDGNQDRPNP